MTGHPTPDAVRAIAEEAMHVRGIEAIPCQVLTIDASRQIDRIVLRFTGVANDPADPAPGEFDAIVPPPMAAALIDQLRDALRLLPR